MDAAANLVAEAADQSRAGAARPERRPTGVAEVVLPWLSVAALIIFGFVAFGAFYRPISDPDTFWHLRLGDQLWHTWTFVGPEPWSSMATRPLVYHEWVPELAYAWAYSIGGYAAVVWVQAAGATVVLLVLYVCCRQFTSPPAAAILSIASFVGAAGSLQVRPQVASVILLTVFVTAWLKTSRDQRPRWYLIPLTFLWAMSHGMWFLGVVVGGLVLGGMVLDRSVATRTAVRIALVPLLGICVAGLTPVGPRLLTTAGGMTAYTSFVSEWAPPAVFEPRSVATLAMALLVVVLWARREGRTRWVDLGVWAFGVMLALTYVRTVALGAVVLGVLAAAQLGLRQEPARYWRRREVAAVGVGMVAVLAFGPLLATGDVSRPEDVPTKLTSALRELAAGTVVFNAYELGGWLLWAEPDLDPVLDGRADVYDVDYFTQINDAYALKPGWEETVEKTGARVALLPHTAPLARALQGTQGWHVIATDHTFDLLAAPG
jgi:hypothetical protein